MTRLKTEVRQEQKRVVRSVPDKPHDLREENLGYIRNIAESEFGLAKNLAETFDTEIWKNWGFKTFQEYVEQELKMEYRNAMFRVQRGKAIVEFNIDKDQFDRLGQTKFTEMSHLLSSDMSKKDIEGLISRVEGKTFKEVQDYVRKERLKKSGGKITKKVTEKFTFTDEQADVVNNAITEAMRLAETDNRNVGIEYICMEWLMNHDPNVAEKVKASLAKQSEPEKKLQKPHAKPAKAKKEVKAKKGGKSAKTKGVGSK